MKILQSSTPDYWKAFHDFDLAPVVLARMSNVYVSIRHRDPQEGEARPTLVTIDVLQYQPITDMAVLFDDTKQALPTLWAVLRCVQAAPCGWRDYTEDELLSVIAQALRWARRCDVEFVQDEPTRLLGDKQLSTNVRHDAF